MADIISEQLDNNTMPVYESAKMNEAFKELSDNPDSIELLVTIIKGQADTITDLRNTIKDLQETIKELKAQLNQNSQNSSKPPSSDGYKKPKIQSLRKKTGNKVGGQDGHPGSNMTIPHAPDEIKRHLPEKCMLCPHLAECMANGVFSCGEKRYEVEAIVDTRVTEHQSVCVGSCPYSGECYKGEFPENVKAYVQYGDSVVVLAGLLSTYGAVSINRIHVLLSSLLGVSLSTGTINSMLSRCAKQVGETLEKIKILLQGQKVAHFDETGTRVNGKTVWIHNSSTKDLTYQTVSEKRGKIGIDKNGVLPAFSGTAMHDCWSPYWKYGDVKHAVCNAHLLRELTGVEQYSPDHKWAPGFKSLLRSMKKAKDLAIKKGKSRLSYYYLHKFDVEYDRLMKIADEECPMPPDDPTKKRGRKKRGKERALIERLMALKGSVCLFIQDFDVPFDNNQALCELLFYANFSAKVAPHTNFQP